MFFVAGLAELNRPPFDMPVADAEIIFGPYTEYTGLRFALFLLAEYAGIVLLCVPDGCAVPRRVARPVLATRGSGRSPRPACSRSSVIWVRVSYPRLRADQLQRLAWQMLIPVALAQLLLTGVVTVAW